MFKCILVGAGFDMNMDMDKSSNMSSVHVVGSETDVNVIASNNQSKNTSRMTFGNTDKAIYLLGNNSNLSTSPSLPNIGRY